jgi:hypothetical protein
LTPMNTMVAWSQVRVNRGAAERLRRVGGTVALFGRDLCNFPAQCGFNLCFCVAITVAADPPRDWPISRKSGAGPRIPAPAAYFRGIREMNSTMTPPFGSWT